MALGEVLCGIDDPDHTRGEIFNDTAGGTYVFTANPPNSPIPDIRWPSTCSTAMNLPSANLPCIEVLDGPNHTAASRSHHPGGVQATFCDGSVRFVSETIGLTVWQGLGTMAGRRDLSY